jgi:ribosomal 30S subunit maturation factor RimM
MWLRVGKLTRPHGVRGELRLDVGTAELPEITRVRIQPKHGPVREGLYTMLRDRPT